MTTTAPLPPYSGEKTPCAKCAFPEARTAYREAGSYRDDEPRLFGPSPRPERLQRECFRCDYVWDEALNPPGDPAAEPAREPTVTELVDVLAASHRGWALDLSPELAAHMAAGLLQMLDIRVRPEHPTQGCCVCAGGPIVYRNYEELPFCAPCSECPCGQPVCVRTGINAVRTDGAS